MVPKHSSERLSPESGLSETALRTAGSFTLLGIYFPGNLINLRFSTACTPRICARPAAHPPLPKLDLISQGWSDHVTEVSGLCVEHAAAVRWQICWVSASITEEEGVRGALGQCRIDQLLVVAETPVICNNQANCHLGTR